MGMNFDQNVKVAHQEIKCPTEKIAETATSVAFPNIANTGDCMGDALRSQKKDVSKFTISINADGTLTFHSDGWPDLKLNFPGDGTVNFDQNVKIAHKEIKCPSEKISET